MIAGLLKTLARKPTIAHIRNMSGGHGRWKYRTGPDDARLQEVILAKTLGGFMWFWIFWHCYYQSEKMFGAFPDVHPELFTNEELGIPDDDEEVN